MMVGAVSENHNPTPTFFPRYSDGMNTISDIMRLHKKSGGHFFDKQTMDFFQSQCYPEVFGSYFITSEVSPDSVMRYTVRRFSASDGAIDTVGNFFAYENLSDAIDTARNLFNSEDSLSS